MPLIITFFIRLALLLLFFLMVFFGFNWFSYDLKKRHYTKVERSFIYLLGVIVVIWALILLVAVNIDLAKLIF